MFTNYKVLNCKDNASYAWKYMSWLVLQNYKLLIDFTFKMHSHALFSIIVYGINTIKPQVIFLLGAILLKNVLCVYHAVHYTNMTNVF